jgi:hypothetical protein
MLPWGTVVLLWVDYTAVTGAPALSPAAIGSALLTVVQGGALSAPT